MYDDIERGPSQSIPESEYELSDQDKDQTIESLLTTLDFVPTPELIEARQTIIDVLAGSEVNPDATKAAWMNYADIADNLVGTTKEYSRAHIAATIHKAMIFRDVHNPERYIEELQVAEELCYYDQGLNELSMALKDELARCYVEYPDISAEIFTETGFID